MSIDSYADNANLCVVCAMPLDESYTERGIAMVVYHHRHKEKLCGRWLHEQCQGHPEAAPMCPCGWGRAYSGIHPDHVDRAKSADDSEEESDGDTFTLHFDLLGETYEEKGYFGGSEEEEEEEEEDENKDG